MTTPRGTATAWVANVIVFGTIALGAARCGAAYPIATTTAWGYVWPVVAVLALIGVLARASDEDAP